ncbi:uncharacterized protein TRIADDRAFT_30458 [Trichoplax adhaerens]|uniref:Rho guanine nucleotide exchange factor 3 n=1 Tax=Trichoplax adhaerens TaxID=10228 RepID=B3S742_TRIAD|nr:hypothetical protein TRIADDRAFT_30458 [Trichoplax adhaerens]EDV21416.1 hypothetical protein TRIADDRAFT_30458 [Trichoplax adhaerens]|eukprot:XP_002116016.1 hypothetical protein TRIADDRAFT_30458 [Trichoplax adhaerens]
MSKIQIMRQEAIYELYSGEVELVQDLKTLKEACSSMVYYNPMHTLKILKPNELQEIFGNIHEITPLHEDLVQKIMELQQANGSVNSIGTTLIVWFPKLLPYLDYCANLFTAKLALEEKRRDKQVADFLERCKQSPFSRKLDVWDFLDKPRSRLMKYSLLLKNITKLTSTEHPDYSYLLNATSSIENFVSKVDIKAGMAKCSFIQSKLFYVTDDQHIPLIDESRLLLCSGIVKNKAGTKLHIFLFEKVLVLCRQATRNEVFMYQVHRHPIPVASLAVEDVPDENIRTNSLRGSFKDALSGKNFIRVSNTSSKRLQYLLQVNDEHDKKQWLNELNQAVSRHSHAINV